MIENSNKLQDSSKISDNNNTVPSLEMFYQLSTNYTPTKADERLLSKAKKIEGIPKGLLIITTDTHLNWMNDNNSVYPTKPPNNKAYANWSIDQFVRSYVYPTITNVFMEHGERGYNFNTPGERDVVGTHIISEKDNSKIEMMNGLVSSGFVRSAAIITDKTAKDHIANLRYHTVSIAASTLAYRTCTLCGKEIKPFGFMHYSDEDEDDDKDYCKHTRGHIYDGITAGTNKWLDRLFEKSLVSIPADPHATIKLVDVVDSMRKADDNIDVNGMDLRDSECQMCIVDFDPSYKHYVADPNNVLDFIEKNKKSKDLIELNKQNGGITMLDEKDLKSISDMVAAAVRDSKQNSVNYSDKQNTHTPADATIVTDNTNVAKIQVVSNLVEDFIEGKIDEKDFKKKAAKELDIKVQDFSPLENKLEEGFGKMSTLLETIADALSSNKSEDTGSSNESDKSDEQNTKDGKNSNNHENSDKKTKDKSSKLPLRVSSDETN